MKLNIIEELGFGSLSPANQNVALENAGGVILQNVLVKIMEHLNDGEREKLEQLIGNYPESGGALIEFLGHNVPDFQSVIQEEVAGFKRRTAQVMKQL